MALGGEGGDSGGVAAYAKGADGSLLDFVFEEAEEGVVLKVGGGDLVKEPEVDVAGAESGETAFEGGFCLGGGERGAGWARGGGFG